MEIMLNGEPREVSEETSLAGLIEELGLARRPVAVELNLAVVPRAEYAGRRLAAGDRLEIVSLVGGG